ncbi:hypothetical protein D3C72_1307530 [compost metagenome]
MMSFAAVAERCASSRTSCATTAKPLPASPARAASTPAFSARRFVWKAISSMTLMIWLISREACSMRSMAETASRTTLADSSVFCLVSATMALASCARSVELRTTAVISSSAAEVSSSAAACCSVRFDRSSAAERSSLALPLMPSVLPRTSLIVSRSLVSVWLTFSWSSPNTPRNSPSILSVRSPRARPSMTRLVSDTPLWTPVRSELIVAAKRLRFSSP